MKNAILLNSIGIYLLLNAQIVSAQSNGLVAHWDFNGSTEDVSGNNLHGLSANASQQFTYGFNNIANTALLFNGISDILNVPYNMKLNLNKYTIAAVVKPTGFYEGLCQTNVVLSRGHQYQSDYYALMMTDQSHDYNCYNLDTANFVFRSYPQGNSDDISAWYYTPTITSNTWYCVVATYDGIKAKVYIDGVLKSTLDWQNQFAPSQSSLNIGGYDSASYPYYFDGVIDDIQLYNRSFAATEALKYCIENTTGTINAQIENGGDTPIVFPTVVKDKFTLRLPTAWYGSRAQLYTIQGVPMMQYNVLPAYDNQLLIPTDFATGIYILKVTQPNEVATFKIIKQ